MAKFDVKIKIRKFRANNAWVGYFWDRILKNYGHIWNRHPQICLTAKFCEKQKYLNSGPKIPYLDIFGLKVWNALVIFEISTLKFIQKRVFNSYSEFWNRSAFSKVSGSTFSEGPGPAWDLLYKVCPWFMPQKS